MLLCPFHVSVSALSSSQNQVGQNHVHVGTHQGLGGVGGTTSLPKKRVEVLTPSIPECELIWKYGHTRVGWGLIQ